MQKKSNKITSFSSLLEMEMRMFGIIQLDSGKYSLEIGDENNEVESLDECGHIIQDRIRHLKFHLYNKLKEFNDIINNIRNTKETNFPSFDNVIFLANIRKAYDLTILFSSLSFVTNSITRLFNLDIINISNEVINKFNNCYLFIRTLHSLIMRENYRKLLIEKYLEKNKIASISGPWANLDLDMSERMWSGKEDEEYFEGRQNDRRAQGRYNPEYDVNGYYLVWPEAGTREPYTFDDIEQGDSAYKGNKYYQTG